MCIPIANGIQWAYLDGRAGPGKTILIQGPGQQGLACAFAAKAAGSDCVIVSGLNRDRKRLEIAKTLGADCTIIVDQDNVEQDNLEQNKLEARVGEITKGDGVDICIDTAGAATTLKSALCVIRKGGTILFAAAPADTFPEFKMSDLLARRLTLRPCRGHSYESVEMAINYIASGRSPFHLMATHRFGLADVDLAIRSVGGQGAPDAVHVTVFPWS
jgi:threonine dehydrogenase-like Zn-dependent dehydrogenase